MVENTILVSGYGRLPEGVSSQALYGSVGVILVVDRTDGTIRAADSTLLTQVAREFLREMLLGMSLSDHKEISERIEGRYFGHSQRAVVAAVRRAAEQFERAGSEPPPAPREGGDDGDPRPAVHDSA